MHVPPPPGPQVSAPASPAREHPEPRAATRSRWFLASLLMHGVVGVVCLTMLRSNEPEVMPRRLDFAAMSLTQPEVLAATHLLDPEETPEELPVLTEVNPVPTEVSLPELQVIDEPLPTDAEPEPVPDVPGPPSPPLNYRVRAARQVVAKSAPAPVAHKPAPAVARAAVAPPSGVVEGATELGRNPPPAYPPEARARGITGVVQLLLEVDAGGQVASVRVTNSSGYAVLDEAARLAVLGWRFAPARRGGVPVAARLTQTVRFALSGTG